MNLILKSEKNKLSDVQVAKKADEIFRKEGSSMESVFRLYRKYHG